MLHQMIKLFIRTFNRRSSPVPSASINNRRLITSSEKSNEKLILLVLSENSIKGIMLMTHHLPLFCFVQVYLYFLQESTNITNLMQFIFSFKQSHIRHTVNQKINKFLVMSNSSTCYSSTHYFIRVLEYLTEDNRIICA